LEKEPRDFKKDYRSLGRSPIGWERIVLYKKLERFSQGGELNIL